MSAMCSISTRPLARKRGAGRDQVDDAAAKAERRRQFHRAVQLDAFGLDAARGEMAAGDVGIFGGDADMAPARRVVAAGEIGRLRDGETAAADTEIERRIDLGIVELHQHVVAGDAELRGAEGDEGGDVEDRAPG